MRFAAVLVAVTTGGAVVATAAPAVGSDGWGLNGTYTATSNGDWARTNDSYHDETSVRSTWTITTTCSTKVDCVGHVESDLGWSADVESRGGVWVVKRDVPNWERCGDGTSATGQQIFTFWGANDQGYVDIDSTTYAGFDRTSGPSGACGINKDLVIQMPFRLDKVG